MMDARAAAELKQEYELARVHRDRAVRSKDYYARRVDELASGAEPRKVDTARHMLKKRTAEVEHYQAQLDALETRAIQEAWR